MSDQLDQLREEYPGWQFGRIWTTANTGPDMRRMSAQQGTVLLTAWTAPELREKLRHEREAAPPA